jgi:hypothetical protein
MLAAIRPTDWGFPLFLHILGAMVLVGGLLVAVAFQFMSWRRRDPNDVAVFARAAFRALLFVAFPGWIVMRAGAQWIYSKEGLTGDNDPAWIGIGFITAEPGLVVLLLAIVLAGLGARRWTVLARIATPFATILLVAYVIAVWAMTAKPN